MTQSLADFLEVFQDVNKTAILLLLMGLTSLLLVKGYVTAGNYTDLMKTITVSYFGTATVAHFTSMVKDHLASKIPTALVGAKEES